MVLAAIAAVAYYVGSPPPLPTVQSSATACPPTAPLVLIPPGLGLNSSEYFQPPQLTVVLGINNTLGWNDQDTTVVHVVSSVSVPPGGVNWDLNITGGQSYCVTLPVAGTYSYEIGFAPTTYSGIITVKTAS